MKNLIIISIIFISMQIHAKINDSLKLDEALVDKAKELVEANDQIKQVIEASAVRNASCKRRKIMREYIELVNQLEKSNSKELNDIKAIQHAIKHKQKITLDDNFALDILKQHQNFRASFNTNKDLILQEINHEDHIIQGIIMQNNTNIAVPKKEITLDSICNLNTNP